MGNFSGQLYDRPVENEGQEAEAMTSSALFREARALTTEAVVRTKLDDEGNEHVEVVHSILEPSTCQWRLEAATKMAALATQVLDLEEGRRRYDQARRDAKDAVLIAAGGANPVAN